MTPFDGFLLLEEDGDRYWRLRRSLTYTGARDTWTIPEDFRTDLASVPRIFTPLVPKSGTHARAAVVHDYLCRLPGVSFKDADGVLRRVCRELGVSPWRREAMYAAVRFAHMTFARVK